MVARGLPDETGTRHGFAGIVSARHARPLPVPYLLSPRWGGIDFKLRDWLPECALTALRPPLLPHTARHRRTDPQHVGALAGIEQGAAAGKYGHAGMGIVR